MTLSNIIFQFHLSNETKIFSFNLFLLYKHFNWTIDKFIFLWGMQIRSCSQYIKWTLIPLISHIIFISNQIHIWFSNFCVYIFLWKNSLVQSCAVMATEFETSDMRRKWCWLKDHIWSLSHLGLNKTKSRLKILFFLSPTYNTKSAV